MVRLSLKPEAKAADADDAGDDADAHARVGELRALLDMGLEVRPVPIGVEPLAVLSMNCTVPVGMPVPEVGATVAVKTTVWP